jgi:hypothetical protein
MKRSFVSGKTLHNKPGIFINQNTHTLSFILKVKKNRKEIQALSGLSKENVPDGLPKTQGFPSIITFAEILSKHDCR